jgi:ubiquinone/menaquinone biosynthesis C-methylase UbiE
MDDEDELKRQWAELAPAWIREAREGPNPTRTGLLDAPMLECCGDVQGRRVLDCGCGEGRFCRILLERGAGHVLGLDLCELMIDAASSLQSERDAYRVADVQNLHFIEDESFDLAISYLNQCDLPDFEANNREVHRVLRRGGRFVVANLHPMRSAVGTWQKASDGTKQHVVVDKYFDEGERRWRMMGVEITNFHRTMETYLSSFLNSGFAIERVLEPSVTRECLAVYPELDDELRVPNFIVYALRKPGLAQ